MPEATKTSRVTFREGYLLIVRKDFSFLEVVIFVVELKAGKVFFKGILDKCDKYTKL